MEIVFALILFAAGLFFIIKGGDFLVGSAIRLNQITGIKQIIIGATFISIATTLPEVFVSIFAVMAENHGIAVGNAIGSMICNVALVLAMYITFMPQSVKRGEILSKSIFLIVVTLIVIAFASNMAVSWLEGAVLLAAFILFIILNVRESKKRDPHLADCLPDIPVAKQEDCLTPEQKRKSIKKIIIDFCIGQVLLILGAFMLVKYGEHLAHLLNISETVVGFTVIAIGTSLPELTTAITSIRRKTGELALGNVIGSNIINCTLLLGVCGVIGGAKGNSLPLSRETLFISLPVLLVMSLIAILPLLIKNKTYRWQGVLLLLSYAVYVTYLVLTQPV